MNLVVVLLQPDPLQVTVAGVRTSVSYVWYLSLAAAVCATTTTEVQKRRVGHNSSVDRVH